MLLAAARVITLDDEEAQDLVQTTFEIAIRHIGTLREPAALAAWLLRIETREAAGSPPRPPGGMPAVGPARCWLSPMPARPSAAAARGRSQVNRRRRERQRR